MQMLLFGIVMTTVWGGANFYIGHRLIEGSGLDRPWSLVAWGILAAIASLSPFVFFFRRATEGGSAGDFLTWAAYISMGFITMLFVLIVFKDLAFLAAKYLSPPSDPDRRQFFSTLANGGVLASSALGTGLGFREALRLPKVESIEIPIPGLADDLVGFTIAQFSDLHVGPTIRRPFVEEVVKIVNGLDADMIAFTGDLVDGFPNDLASELEPLKDLKSKHGTYYVTGNHEYYWNAPAWVRFVKDHLDFKPLMNAHEVITVGAATLLVGGVTDYSTAERFDPTQKSDPHKAKEGAPDHDASVLLAHQPKSVYKAVEAGFDLQLSGHTHGGQFWPWNLFVGLAHPFHTGLTFYKKAIFAYVNRGTGYWGPPTRLGVPSEVTLLTLKKA